MIKKSRHIQVMCNSNKEPHFFKLDGVIYILPHFVENVCAMDTEEEIGFLYCFIAKAFLIKGKRNRVQYFRSDVQWL